MDEELFQFIYKAKRGDRQAFAELVGRYKGTVFRHAFARVNDHMEAEDIAQEAFTKAFYSLPKLDNEYAFSSWLTKIVSNLCYDHLKKTKNKKTVDVEDYPLESKTSMEQADLKLSIAEGLQKLSDEHRESIILRDIQGFSYEEMAKILNIPLGTVKSRINIARKQLKQELLGGGEDG